MNRRPVNIESVHRELELIAVELARRGYSQVLDDVERTAISEIYVKPPTAVAFGWDQADHYLDLRFQWTDPAGRIDYQRPAIHLEALMAVRGGPRGILGTDRTLGTVSDLRKSVDRIVAALGEYAGDLLDGDWTVEEAVELWNRSRP